MVARPPEVLGHYSKTQSHFYERVCRQSDYLASIMRAPTSFLSSDEKSLVLHLRQVLSRSCALENLRYSPLARKLRLLAVASIVFGGIAFLRRPQSGKDIVVFPELETAIRGIVVAGKLSEMRWPTFSDYTSRSTSSTRRGHMPLRRSKEVTHSTGANDD